MFEYRFVTCPAPHGRETTGAYQDEVSRHAAEGWRLVQVLVENPAAVPQVYTLILERSAQVASVS